MNAIKIPRPEHPEPQWERKNWVNLNGEWQFELDHGASGQDRGLIEAATLKDKITVPFCTESKLSGVTYTDFIYQVWYKKAICFDKSALGDQRVILHIGAADYRSTVWINGILAGKVHVGGQTPFSYDITDLITDGENIVTVSCFDDTRGVQPNGKQCQFYKSRVCRYTRTTGIWQRYGTRSFPRITCFRRALTPILKTAFSRSQRSFAAAATSMPRSTTRAKRWARAPEETKASPRTWKFPSPRSTPGRSATEGFTT